MQPLDQNLKVIRINSRQCHIRQAFVNNVPVKFTFTDAISELSLGSEADVTHHQSYKSKYLTALREADDGELSIELPEDAVKPISELEAQALASGSFVREDSPEIQDTPIPDEKQQQQSQQQEQQQQQPSSATPAAPNVSYAPLTIRIDYSLLNPRSGLVFVEPDPDVAPYRYYHVYTVNQPLPGGTRAWVPCIDRLSDQCTWDMEFIVPMRLGTAISQQDNEDPFDDEEDTMVICSGEVMEQVVHPFDSSKKIVHYSLAVPTAAPFIGFAVGPFQMIKLTPSQLQEEVLTAANLDENQQQSLLAEINMMSTIYAFALPGHSDELTVSCSFLMHTMHFYGQEYGSYPYADYKIVFVEDAWNDIASSASLSICSSHLLHSADVIDQTYNTRRTLSIALAKQWFGVHIVQKSWPDIWLVIGLANYMASLFIKRHLGNNEYRLRLKRDMDLCCSLDINRPPLYNTALPLPLDPEDLNFIELKAPLVLYMLDKRMCKGGSTLGFSRVIPKILVSAMSGELANNALSTHHFLRLCRKISGFDTRIFADQWIYKSGCPRFNFSYRFNRKKMVVEIYMWQENTNVRGASDSNDYLYTPFFTGNFIVRVHEADGTPYEHILEIQSQSQKFEVQFNTKYKRIRRNTKRFIAKQAAAAAAVAEDDPEKDEEGGQTMLDIIPMLGLGMPVFEDEEQRQEWRIVEWGQDEDDTSGAASATFDWIRLDAEFEWLCILEFQQPDYMWAAQLTKDRDVVAQHEAIEALKRMPSLPTSTSLLRALLDPKTFYKIRMEAAYALASCATPSLGWAGLLQLFKAFQKRYCFPLPQDRMDLDSDIPIVPVVPKPNNFSNLPDYFLQKAMVIAFSEIRDETGLPPLKVRQFLLDLLKYNDNTGNEFSDSYYVATLISAVGDSLIPVGESQGAMDAETEQLLEAAKAEIDRFRTLDYVVPSYHNVVTIACLQTITKLMVNGLMDVDLSMFLLYSRYGNYFEVRCAAFDSLFVLCGLSDDSLVQYFISIIKYDPSTYISHYVARAMLAWLGLAVKEKMSVSHSAGVREEFAEEEGGAAIENDQQKVQGTAQDELYSGIEDLRKRFEANKELQQTLWDMLHSSENLSILDHCIRKYILQLCEYLYKPIDSGLKVTIRMPPTSEQPATSEEAPTEERQAPILRLSMSRPAAAAEIEASEKKQKKSLKRARPETTVPVSPPPSSNASPEPVKPSAPAFDQMPTDQLKNCRRILGKLQKHRSAILFLQPVDEDLDRAPNYYKIIKEPMDLGTVKTKLDRGLYSSFEDFESDIRLIFHNCFLYNRPGTYVYNEGQALEAIFDEELANLRGKEETQNMTIVEGPIPIISPQPVRDKTDMEKCEVVLSNLMENQHAFEFLRPVDPVKQGIPYYFDIIKNPMDLGTVKTKLRNGKYSSIQDFDKDIRLMFRNCYTFNAPTTYVYNEGKMLEEAYDNEWRSVFGQEPRSSSLVDELVTQRQPKPKKRKTEKTEMEKCAFILSNLIDNKHALPFLEPVDPVKLNIPQYFDIIKHPMDLSTIKNKLNSGQYANRIQFNDDVRLMLSNCFTFNPPGNFVHNEGKQLEKVYEKTWSKQFKDEAPQAAANVPTPDSTPVAQVSTPAPQPPPQPPQPSPPPPAAATPAAAPVIQTQQDPAREASPTMPTTTVTVKPAKSDMEKCADILEQTMQDRHSTFFLEPVDPVKLNVPTYFDIIKHPMDLGTIKEKLNSGQYTEPSQLNDDVRLMFNNCYTFNPPKTFVHEEGKLLEKAYERHWKKAFGTKPPGGGASRARSSTISPQTDMEKCTIILEKLMQNRHATAFLLPVDPIALNIPHYFEIIKHPMDLSTIKRKLENHEYSNPNEFDSDVRLMLQNCYTFNPPTNFVHGEGKQLEKAYEREWKKWFK